MMLIHDLNDVRAEAEFLCTAGVAVAWSAAHIPVKPAAKTSLRDNSATTTLACITNKVLSSHHIRRLAACAAGETELHKLASAIFAPTDAALAIRDLKSWKEGRGNGAISVRAMGARLATQQAVLVLELDDDHVLKGAVLINSGVCHEKIDADACARLMTLASVTTVCCTPSNLMLLEFSEYTAGREACRVAPSVRAAHGAVTQAPPQKGAASKSELAALGNGIDAKLAKLEKKLADGTTAKLPAPEYTEKLHESAQQLERLLKRKRDVGSGSKPPVRAKK